jgi:hypothetical protein
MRKKQISSLKVKRAIEKAIDVSLASVKRDLTKKIWGQFSGAVKSANVVKGGRIIRPSARRRR